MQDERRKGGEIFIVDNSDTDWKVKQYLHEWADIATKFDIATGYFEIGALLALDGQWQKLEQILDEKIIQKEKANKAAKAREAIQKAHGKLTNSK